MRPEVHDDVIDPPHALIVGVLHPGRRVLLSSQSDARLKLTLYCSGDFAREAINTGRAKPSQQSAKETVLWSQHK